MVNIEVGKDVCDPPFCLYVNITFFVGFKYSQTESNNLVTQAVHSNWQSFFNPFWKKIVGTSHSQNQSFVIWIFWKGCFGYFYNKAWDGPWENNGGSMRGDLERTMMGPWQNYERCEFAAIEWWTGCLLPKWFLQVWAVMVKPINICENANLYMNHI